MKCIHPHIHDYIDPVSGKTVSIEIPCGKCIACLHNQQDSWSIRLLETAKASRYIIYDTLTVRPSSMSYKDVLNEAFAPLSHFSDDTWQLLKKYDFSLPYCERSVIRAWIKRGRENYFNATGKRLLLKYFCVQEYGPSTSRCHFHILVFGVSYPDYITYFAQPWREDMGFTKTKYISRPDKTMKDRQCIVRYVSKYVSKGVFESPLVRDNFLPKPFRCISHGIGEEYLNKSCFDVFRNSVFKFWSSLPNTDDLQGFKDCAFFGVTAPLSRFGIDSEKLFRLFGTYYDEKGFPHSLPRYYKSKLLNLQSPNLFGFAVQSELLKKRSSDIERRYFNTAVALGLDVSKWDFSAPYYGLRPSEYPCFVDATIYTERYNARNACRNKYIMLRNHYKRILTNPQLSLYQ